MTDIESRLRAAAFGADTGVPDAVLAEAEIGEADEPLPRWLAAVVLGARGQYARAAALLEPLLTCRDGVLASLAASTLASHRRQLGGHANARTLDAAALRARPGAAGSGAVVGAGDPDGIDVAGAVADALLGLAADALALGRQREARTLLARVAAANPSCWRTRVRHAWVSAEVELAAGAAVAACPHAERAAAIARERGASRHVLKSDLVLAAALGAVGVTRDTAGVIVLAGRVRDDTRKLGLYPLTWPAALLLADATGIEDAAAARELRREASGIVHALLQRADPLGRSLAIASPWVPKVG
ncbi:hypothetical protein [Haloechinothrix salitolerans]|uniref:Tetratricopeptide repeat-containing protein n=1 Tax=Haloechinothrix salitolerans TaxID=926830 RepID=A0ABW2C7H1_9PSEU